jgi:UDP-glucose:(heptosyl)LPS alpha-1,3-glucosyltransferase
MRLWLVLDHFTPRAGGAEGVAAAVVRELVRRGHAVTVLAGDGEPLAGCELRILPPAGREAAVRGVRPGILVLDWGLTVPAHVHRLGGGLTRSYLRWKHAARPPALRIAARLFDALRPRIRRELAREGRLLRRGGARLLAVSEFVARHVREIVPEAAGRITVLHNGVDTVRFTPANRERRREAVRAGLGLAPEDVAFLFVAHNPRLKNFALLERVCDRLAPRLPNLRLVVLGRHPPARSAPWLIQAGCTDTPEDAYAAADGLLLPTFYDACANVVLEAIAAGLPVVSSNLNGSAELINHGRDGFVLPVTGLPAADIEQQWAEQVERLVAGGADARGQIGHAARILAEAHAFTRYMDRLIDYLEKAPPER